MKLGVLFFAATATESSPELTATAASTAVVQIPEISHVMVPTTNLNKNSSERLHINVIPAANIKNFGKKKSHPIVEVSVDS